MEVQMLHGLRMKTVIAAAALLSATALGQETFRVDTNEVLIPVTVTGKDKKFVEGLTADDFTVLDNGKRKPARVEPMDLANVKVAIVVAVQLNDISAPALTKVRKTGSLIQPLLAGEGGRAAVIGFGDRLEVLEQFTPVGGMIAEAFEKLQPQRPTTADFQQFDPRRARFIDAVIKGVHMLAGRPSTERRVLLVVGETRDRGSESKLEDALSLAQQHAVTVYHASFSAYRTAFTTKAGEVPVQPGGADYLGGLREAFRRGKVNDAELLAKQTGGLRLTFATLGALEKIVARFGEEVHSQYLLIAPAESSPPGYRTLEVRVRNSALAVRARPGYWVAP